MSDTNEAATEVENSGFSGLFVAPTAEELDEILPQFEIKELIGQGGMGAVYKARQPRLDRYVAIKLLPAFAKGDQHQYGERFEREARAMAQLNHPNVVTVHDFGETDAGHRYIVMEYVEGSDLHALIQGGKLTNKHALAWIPLICSAIDYAHEKGIVHRDIKPANILISQEGEVKVSDFGLAKLMGKQYNNALTQTQMSMGTPDYAAPEALDEGAEVDRRADVYSLGVLFYELLTGKVPRGAWRPPSAFLDVDVRVDQIIVKAMQPDPNHRYQAVSGITQALKELREPAPEPSNVPKLVTKSAAAKPKTLLTGAVKLPSKEELEEMLADNPAKSTRPGTRVSRVPAAASPPPSSGMNPVMVGIIALGGVFLVVGVILLLLSQGGDEPTPGPTPPIVAPATPDPEPDTPIVQTPPVAPPSGDKGKGKGKKGPRIRPIEPREGWVDLLSDLELGEGFGAWNRRPGGGLALEQVGSGRSKRGWMPFPVAPGMAYEIETTILPNENKPIMIHLPVGSSSVLLQIGVRPEGNSGGTFFAGLSQVNGAEAFMPKNPTRTEIEYDADLPMKLAIRVVTRGRKTGIALQRDGVDVFRWSGNSEDLSVREQWTGLGGRRIAVGSQTPMLIESALVRALPKMVQIPSDPDPEPDERPWVDALLAFDVESATITGDWSFEEGALRISAAADPTARPRIELPLVPRGSYQIETRFHAETDGDIVFLLPIDDEHYAPLHLAANGDTMGLSLAGSPIGAVGNATAMPSAIEVGSSQLGLIEVRRRENEVRVSMHIDGAARFNWIGSPNELPTDHDWPPRDKSKVTLGALASVKFDFVRIKGVDPKSVPEPPPSMSPELEGVKLRLTELEGRFGEEIQNTALEHYDKKVADLNEQYNGALNNILTAATTNQDQLLIAAATRERERLRNGEPIEEADPPEMPDGIKTARGIYRTETKKYEVERDKLMLPILREYLAAVEMLLAEYAQLENPEAIAYISETKKKLEAQIFDLLQSAGVDEPAMDEPAPTVSPAAAGDRSAGVLDRPPFPRERPEERGEVISFKRRPEAQTLSEGAGEVPAGLSTTAVAITGAADIFAAIKSNGRVELWGSFENVPQQIQDLRDIAHIAIGQGEDDSHIAWMDESGKIDFYSIGWAEDSIGTFKTQAASIPEPVDLLVGPNGGLAVLAEGKIGFWGQIGFQGVGDLEDIVKIAAGPGVAVALKSDGSLSAVGAGAQSIVAQVPKARDVVFGLHPDPAAVALLPDYKVKSFGAFASAQTELDQIESAEKIVAGVYAFAVDVGDGDWRFFGDNIDAEYCQQQAAGCSQLVIGRDFIIGLRPN